MKTISLVVIWGLFHGLVLLPTFLSLIPHFLLEFNCYRAIFGKHLFGATAGTDAYGSNSSGTGDASASNGGRKQEDQAVHEKDDRRHMNATELRILRTNE